jgi:FeS assembly protein IscX
MSGDNPILSRPLYWDAAYEVALALIAAYPHVDVNQVGLNQIRELVVALPNFADNPAHGYDALLEDILKEWYEEATANV